MSAELSSPSNIPPRRILYETLIVLAITVLPALFLPPLRSVAALLPIAYALVERQMRKRPWSTLGFKIRQLPAALKDNWLLILLVLALQFIYVYWARASSPAVLDHILSRLPAVLSPANLVVTLLLLAVAVFGEELAFRGLFQERLSWFIATPLAVVLISLLFALMHFSPGNPLIVAFDLIGVFLDSVVYGFIFARGRNIFASWLAHFLADVVGLVLLFQFM